jgi:hypothetical protein
MRSPRRGASPDASSASATHARRRRRRPSSPTQLIITTNDAPPPPGTPIRQGGRVELPQHQHRRRRLSSRCPVRAAFVVLLFLWIALELSLAQIHLSGSGVAIAGGERYVNGTTAAASFVGGGVNKTAIPPSIGAAGGVVAFLLRALSSSVDDDPGRPRRTAERDYVLVFYVLMMANVFAMVPSW